MNTCNNINFKNYNFEINNVLQVNTANNGKTVTIEVKFICHCYLSKKSNYPYDLHIKSFERNKVYKYF